MSASVFSLDTPERRLAIVVLTHNRRDAVLGALARLTALERPFPVCVVDNGSSDGSAQAIARHFGNVQLVRLPRNMGAAGRNFGVREVSAHYVAFCDDNSCWADGTLSRAITLMDEFPRLGAISARVLPGAAGADITLPGTAESNGLPGTEVASLTAGACIMRRNAFLAAGGYEPRLSPGGEESLLAMDMQAKGWRLAYVPELVLYRYCVANEPRPALPNSLRNALWCAWLRRPAISACRETLRQLRRIARDPQLAPGLLDALRGVPWVWRQRRVLPAEVEHKLRRMEESRTAC